MSNERESQEVKEFKGDIGGVNNRLADSAVNGQYFQSIEGIMPWEGEHRRIFGKKTSGKVWSATSDRLSVITLHALPGNHMLIQTREGLMMDSPYDPATLDWSIRAGVTGIATLQNVDRLVRALREANLWGKFMGLYPFAGGTSLAHSQNLISPSYPITWVNGPTHNSLGVKGNGTASYGYMTGSEGTLPHLGHLSVYVNQAADIGLVYADYIGAGNEGGSAVYYIIQSVVADSIETFAGHLASAFGASGLAPLIGFFHQHRRSTVELVGYKNAVVHGTSVTFDNNTPPVALPLGLCCRIDIGGAPSEFCDATFSLASFGHQMTHAEAVAFDDIIQTYETTMGRAV